MDSPTSPPAGNQWIVYVLRCSDGSYYCGITTDLERRLLEHNTLPSGAAYTRARRPVVFLKSWSAPDRSAATKAERAFKALSRQAKELRIAPGGEMPGRGPH